MKKHTLDVLPDEMLMMALLLGQFIERHNKVLRRANTKNEAEQARARLEIATRLRGKLPMFIEHGSDEDTP